MHDQSHNPATDPLAQAAIAEIEPGMIVGLGTGRAADRATRALAQRNQSTDLNIKCVPTSDRTAQLARSLDLPLIHMRDAIEIDHLFDGADEVDPKLQLIKGAGGAMTREKIAAAAARRRLYLITPEKRVERLGQNFRVPIEVLEDALGLVTIRLEWLKLDPQLRMQGNQPARTDLNNPIIDAKLPDDLGPDKLEVMLRLIPGIVGHGLFLTEAQTVIIDQGDGTIQRLDRNNHPADMLLKTEPPPEPPTP